MSIFNRQTKSQKFAKNAQEYGVAVLGAYALALGVQAISNLINGAVTSVASGAANIKEKRDSANVAKEAQADAATEASAPAQEASAQEAPATPAG